MTTKRHFFYLISSFILVLFFSLPANAKEISLYSDPQDTSKVIGKIDASLGVVPIFSSKDGKWMKVGDPRNGNVGWIKSNEVMGQHSSSFTFIQRTIDDGKEPQTYQLIQFGQPQTLTPEQSNAQAKKIQAQQQAIQQNMQKTIQNMLEGINSFYKQQDTLFQSMPFFMPIIVVPAQPADRSNTVKPQESAKTDIMTTSPTKH